MPLEPVTSDAARLTLGAIPSELVQLHMQLMLTRDRIVRLANSHPGEIAVDHLVTLTTIDDYLRRACTAVDRLKVASYALKTRQ